MDTVRLGVIGCGGMAQAHMRYFETIPGLRFVAAADAFADNLNKVTAQYKVQGFDDGRKLIASGEVDAILIATPHHFHPELSIAGLEAGLHVLTEKPVAVTAYEAQKVEAVHAQRPHLVYAAMFQTRNHPLWRRVRSLVDSGAIGRIQRVAWIVTNWFRSQAYYNQAAWRATWKGEGGGVLLNQCPHNLDTLCWLVGTPSRVRAFTALGKHHHIEVEDEVTAYLEWDGHHNPRVIPQGATGVFVTSTGEAPGTDRLELAGDRGKLTVEGGAVTLIQTDACVSEFIQTTDEAFGNPNTDTLLITPTKTDGGHRAVTANFIDAVLKPGTTLICPGESGLHELELGNAMLYSGLMGGEAVPLPMDRKAFDEKLRELIRTSNFQKGELRRAKVDMDKSFH